MKLFHSPMSPNCRKVRMVAEYLGIDRISGPNLTIADLTVAAMLSYSEVGPLPLDNYHHIREWLERIEALDAWKKTKPPSM